MKYVHRLIVVSFILFCCGSLPSQSAPAAVAAIAPPLPSPASGKDLLIDGVSVQDFQALQLILLKAAAADKDVLEIDAQIRILRAQRAELSFKAALLAHPEMTEKLKIMWGCERERQKQEVVMTREAARLFKAQDSK